MTTGVLDYFPDAIAEVARVSKAGNDQHNPGEPLHWAREKSTDHADCIARHLLERGTVDVDGQRHSAKMAWRALALLQTELEAEEELVDPVSDPPGKVQRVDQTGTYDLPAGTIINGGRTMCVAGNKRTVHQENTNCRTFGCVPAPSYEDLRDVGPGR